MYGESKLLHPFSWQPGFSAVYDSKPVKYEEQTCIPNRDGHELAHEPKFVTEQDGPWFVKSWFMPISNEPATNLANCHKNHRVRPWKWTQEAFKLGDKFMEVCGQETP